MSRVLMSNSYLTGLSTEGNAGVYSPTANSFALAGRSQLEPDRYQGVVILTDVVGGKIWSKIFSEYLTSFFGGVAFTATGQVLAVGSCSSDGSTQVALAARYDQNGNLIRSKTFSKGSESLATGIIPTADGGSLISALYSEADKQFGWAIKLDSSDNLQWEAIQPLGGMLGVAQGTDGSFLMAGSQPGPNFENSPIIWKLDPQGNTVWAKTYGTVSNILQAGLTQDSEGNITVAGSRFLMQADADGNENWFRTMINPVYSGVTSVGLGHFVACGTFENKAGSAGGYVIEFGRDGKTPFSDNTAILDGWYSQVDSMPSGVYGATGTITMPDGTSRILLNVVATAAWGENEETQSLFDRASEAVY